MSDLVMPWLTLPFGSVAKEMCLGKMLDKQKNRGTLQPYLRNINVRWFSFDLTDLKEMRFEGGEEARYRLQPGDLVVCEGGEPGRAAVWKGQTEDAKIQKALHRIRFRADEYDPTFAMYYLYFGTFTNRFESYYTGSTIKHLTGAALSQIQFPVPTIQEQRQIVSKIEELFSELDAGVASLLRVRANLKRYRAAILAAAVEGKLTEKWRRQYPDTEHASTMLDRIRAERRSRWEEDKLAKFAMAKKQPPNGWREKYQPPEPFAKQPDDNLPIGWCWATWEQLSARVTIGHVGPMKHEYVSEGIPFLRSQNVRENKFDPQGLLAIPQRFHIQLEKSTILPGDLAVVRSGSVGVTCVIPEWLGEANCSDLVLIQKPIGIISEYGSYYMNSAARTLVRAGTVGIALTHFNTRSVASLPVPLPPREEQLEIVKEVGSRLSVVDEIEVQVEANLKRAARLRQGILKRAFEGRLVLQDPNDEPAKKLLAQIASRHKTAHPSTKGNPTPLRRGRTRKAGTKMPLFTQGEGDDQGNES